MKSSLTNIPHEQYYLPDSHGQFSPQQNDFISLGNVVRTDKNLIVKDFFIADDSEVKMLRGQRFFRKGISTLITGAVYTMASTEYLIGLTSLSYSPSIGLPKPSIAGVGKTYRIKDETGGAATTTITIRSDGEANIDGATSLTITTNYGSKAVYTDGSNWFTY